MDVIRKRLGDDKFETMCRLMIAFISFKRETDRKEINDTLVRNADIASIPGMGDIKGLLSWDEKMQATNPDVVCRYYQRFLSDTMSMIDVFLYGI